MLALVYRRLQPVGYRVEEAALVIERRSGERRIDGPVSGGRVGSLGLRLLGSGGLYGYSGWMLVRGGGRVRAFVTDRRRTVILDVGAGAVAISPATAGPFLDGAADA